MTKFLALVFAAILSLSATRAFAPAVVTAPHDYVYIHNVSFNDAQAYLEAAKKQIAKHPEYLRIIIDSNGGSYDSSTIPFLAFLDSLVANGVRVECIINKKAYSMGAVFLSHCNRRLATKGSNIMWHGVRLNSPSGMNQFELDRALGNAKNMDILVWTPLMKIVNDDEFFWTNFKKERIIPVEELVKTHPHILQIVDLEITK